MRYDKSHVDNNRFSLETMTINQPSDYARSTRGRFYDLAYYYTRFMKQTGCSMTNKISMLKLTHLCTYLQLFQRV